MNKRTFLKTFGLVIPGIFLTNNLFGNTKKDELQDCYDFIESKLNIKLYSYQKEILTDIHNNDKLIIVKARQIGMTTLLAGYYCWLSYQKNIWDWYIAPNCGSLRNYYDIKSKMKSKLIDLSVHDNILFVDERNFHSYFNTKNLFSPALNYKTIVCGSVDKPGNLKRFIDEHQDWKTVYYSIHRCGFNSDMCDVKKLSFQKNCHYYPTEEYNREMLCQFV